MTEPSLSEGLHPPLYSIHSFYLLNSLCVTPQAKQTLAAECMEKELKVLKDEVRALHVSFIQWTLAAVLNSGFHLSCFLEIVVVAQVFF